MASARGAGAAACGPRRAARRRVPAGRPRSRPLPRLRPSPPGPTPPRRTPGPTPSPVGGARPAARRPPARAAAVGAAAALRPLGLLGSGCPLGWSADSRARSLPRRPRLRDRPFPGPSRRSTLPRRPSASPRDGLPGRGSAQPAPVHPGACRSRCCRCRRCHSRFFRYAMLVTGSPRRKGRFLLCAIAGGLGPLWRSTPVSLAVGSAPRPT